MTMIESQFNNPPVSLQRSTERLRQDYDVIVLPDAKAKGRYPKGRGLNKRTRIKGRQPVYVPAAPNQMEDAIYWLRVKRS